MTSRTLILIDDGDGSGRVQFLEFADGHEAEQRLEQLIAEGIPQESIRAFTATELEMQVSHRPVVSLNGGSASQSAPAPEVAPVTANSQSQDGDPAGQDAAAPADGDGESPMIRDGVRFSSLFKPDGGLEPA